MYEFLLAFLSGVLVKIVDNIEDVWLPKTRNQKLKTLYSRLAWPLAIAYGAIIGYLISQASFSMLFLAALLAQVLAYKIDHEAHLAGFILSIVAALYLGLPQIEYLPFILFLVAAYLDELTLFGIWKTFADYRLFLVITALAFVIIGRIDYLEAILAFDLAYIITEKIFQKGQ